MRLFLYGTLLNPTTLAQRSGDAAAPTRCIAATLHGWQRVALPNGRWPSLRRQRGGQVFGAVADVNAAAVRRLAAYEGEAYRLVPVVVATASGNTAAQHLARTRRHAPPVAGPWKEYAMLQAPPAQPGMREDEIDTPALLIDLDAFEFNLDRMAALLAPTGVKLRAHAKTHKSPVIAKLQMARGAVGQCVQKVAEAEVLAWGGIPDILVSNEVVGAGKLARLCALAKIAHVAVCADDAAQVSALEAAAANAGIRLPVLVEIDVGAARCGVAPGPDAVALAQRIAGSKHLTFGGLQAYHGSAQHKRTVAERRSMVSGAVDASRRTVEQLRQQGLDCAIVGGAGTGTFEIRGGVRRLYRDASR